MTPHLNLPVLVWYYRTDNVWEPQERMLCRLSACASTWNLKLGVFESYATPCIWIEGAHGRERASNMPLNRFVNLS